MRLNYQSHIGQDMWVAELLNYKRDGFFLDFGSLDGVKHNNTYTLETELGWNGICVEANPTYYPQVCANRNVITINNALWRTTGERIEMVDAYGLSSAVAYRDDDSMSEIRQRDTRRVFAIETISPNDLLGRFDLPAVIDYMSLDIEGSEMDVLAALDLVRFPIALMTIEHSELPDKQARIRDHLEPLGYVATKRFYDDLFYHPEYLARLGGSAADAERAFAKVEAEYQVGEV